MKTLRILLPLLLVLVMLVSCGSVRQTTTTGSPTNTASAATSAVPSTTTPAESTQTPEKTLSPSTETPSTETPSTVTPSTVTPTEPSTETPTPTPASESVTLTLAELTDKIAGGWIGQMAGVAWGAPTEFCWAGALIPESSVPAWSSSMINDAFNQDDLYVEIPFMDAMKESGVNCSPSVLAKSFRNTTFALWHANGMGRSNLQAGINYPESGHYLNNYHCDDIDWQIECDFLGMIYPGLVSEAANRAFEVGHIMNYGDGVYGGVFVSAMHAAAFTAKSVREICEAGRKVIPEGTEFRTLIDEVFASYDAGDSFETNWQKLQNKWGGVDICPELRGESNIDAKLNSGYILLGLLYGDGDFAKTNILSMRCGQDSDCNPSSAASILGNFYGESGLPETYKKALDRTKKKFATTNYTFDDTVKLNVELTLQALKKAGATVSEDETTVTFESDLVFTPVPFEQVPDGVFVYTKLKLQNNNLRFFEVTPFGKNEKVVSYTIDTGDGTVFTDVTPYVYTYNTAGEYTVKITARGDKGGVFEKELTYKVKKDVASPDMTSPYFICSITLPTGGGSKDIKVINDGYVPKSGDSDAKQYDTYILGDPHGNPDTTVYIGYVYREEKTVSSVSFTEGNHFGNGGWFKNGQIGVEVLVNGEWIKVATTLDNPYPKGDNLGDFGKPFETYIFTLSEPVVCDGVRLIGLGGGHATFISVGELAIA